MELLPAYELMEFLKLWMIDTTQGFGISFRLTMSCILCRHELRFDGRDLTSLGKIVRICSVLMMPQMRFIESFMTAARAKLVINEVVRPASITSKIVLVAIDNAIKFNCYELLEFESN